MIRLPSLKIRLALIGASLVFMSVLLGSLLVLRGAERETLSLIASVESQQTQKLAQILRNRISLRSEAVAAAADQFESDWLGDSQAIANFLLGQDFLLRLGDTLMIADHSGQVLAVRDGQGRLHQPNMSISNREYFHRVLAQRSVVISEPVRGPVTGLGRVLIAAPLQNPETGEVQAVLVLSLELARAGLIIDLLDQPQDAQEQAAILTLIATRDGHWISHPDPALLMQPVTSDPRFTSVSSQLQASAQGLEYSSNWNTQGRLFSLATVHETPWVLVRSSEQSWWLAGIRAGYLQSMALAMALALGAAGITALFTLSLLDPLVQLRNRAQQALGPDAPPIDQQWPQTGGEIGDLIAVIRRTLHEEQQERAHAEDALRRLSAILARAPVGVAFTRDGRLDLVSEAFCALFGQPAERLIGQATRQLYATDAAFEAARQQTQQCLDRGEQIDLELEFCRPDGSLFWVRTQGTLLNANDPDSGIIWICTDITEQRAERDLLRYASDHDPLTGALNRRALDALLTAHEQQAQPWSLLFLDLDHFKRINDLFGHDRGDSVLRQVVEVLRSRLRDTDRIARYGGDEFVLLLPNCELPRALEVATRLLDAIVDLRLDDGTPAELGVSVGVACSTLLQHCSAEQVLRAADQACYSVKRTGRNGVRVAHHEDTAVES